MRRHDLALAAAAAMLGCWPACSSSPPRIDSTVKPVDSAPVPVDAASDRRSPDVFVAIDHPSSDRRPGDVTPNAGDKGKPTVTQFGAGGSHACALLTTGGVKCWGGNFEGQLGNGAIATLVGTPLPGDVIGLSSGVAAIAVGGNHSCALRTGGGIKCWGANAYGELGDGTTTRSPLPVAVYGLFSGVIAVGTALNAHSCAIVQGGAMKCWGKNLYGQLGNGKTAHSGTPVDVTGLSSGVVAMALGGEHTCALLTGGGLKCWGHNWYGELGDGTYVDKPSPVGVLNL
jgi:alpha-tubulin suppressor-like RCC1 family protein